MNFHGTEVEETTYQIDESVEYIEYGDHYEATATIEAGDEPFQTATAITDTGENGAQPTSAAICPLPTAPS